MNPVSLKDGVALLLSGGVDSSVALCELRRAGARPLVAFYLKIWLEEEAAGLGDCPWREDLQYVRAVCDMLEVPLEIVSLQREYYQRIVAYTLDELRQGHTPSPDILCNQQVKFGVFLEIVADRFPYVASGHYARLFVEEGRMLLCRSPDRVKDQTYFLSHLHQEQLRRLRFPIGGYTKSEVRRLARGYRLPNRDRKDSQGICFLGSIRYDDFVRHYLGVRRGRIIERETGRHLGEHRGYWFHTIGQRRGLGLGDGPWYVVGKDVDANVVSVSRAGVNRARHRLRVDDLHWTAGPPDEERMENGIVVKLRHTPESTPCTLRPIDTGATAVEVTLSKPDEGIAGGQFAVFYDGEICLGGGRIG